MPATFNRIGHVTLDAGTIKETKHLQVQVLVRGRELTVTKGTKTVALRSDVSAVEDLPGGRSWLIRFDDRTCLKVELPPAQRGGCRSCGGR